LVVFIVIKDFREPVFDFENQVKPEIKEILPSEDFFTNAVLSHLQQLDVQLVFPARN
jgi:hypothetical protein